jgi:putative radical SAM enzyme (TIGR03279 family)
MKSIQKNIRLKIKNVNRNSSWAKAGVKQGDILININGHPIRDIIDYQFYSADEKLNCILDRRGKEIALTNYRINGEYPGLDFTPMRFRHCGNRCIFCFVDQNPKGMRQAIYFKDEDFRLSFLHGSYVTLTHMRQDDLERIAEQRLSPLYLSIHATNPEVRKILLGIEHDDHFMNKLTFLIEHNIEIHGQIVLCKGINDDRILEETLDTLTAFYPTLRSMAVVPVGLTRHRLNLTEVHGYDSESALEVVNIIQKIQKINTRRLKESFVFLADEFYLLANIQLPHYEHYGDFWQIENGVGLTSAFLKEFDDSSTHFPRKLDRPKSVVIITGLLAEKVLTDKIIPKLRRIGNLNIEVHSIRNTFFGDSVTVSGLLTGQDIIEALKGENREFEILLPPNCINNDGKLLDDLSPEDISLALNKSVKILFNYNDIWKN